MLDLISVVLILVKIFCTERCLLLPFVVLVSYSLRDCEMEDVRGPKRCGIEIVGKVGCETYCGLDYV